MVADVQDLRYAYVLFDRHRARVLPAILAEWYLGNRHDMLQVERAVEMRKELTATRGLPFQPLAKRLRVDREEDKARLAGEMGGERPGHLPPRREMDETIAEIDGRALEQALPPRLVQGGFGQDFVDWLAHLRSRGTLVGLDCLNKKPAQMRWTMCQNKP